MRVLLVKCHKKTLFSNFEPIVTEPLELEYISAMLSGFKIEHRVYDELLEGSSFENIFRDYQPAVLILSGYITAVNVICEYSKYAKRKNKNIKVIVGGVHAEVNYEDFFVCDIDYIVHSDALNALKNLFESKFNIKKVKDFKGIAYQLNGRWKVNDKTNMNIEILPAPDRSYFNKFKNRTKYLHYSPVAIVKTAISCPFKCNFCYCRELNMGIYSVRSIESVIEEISKIESEYIWIVDDTFLIDRKRIIQFINEIKNRKVNKKFIAYSRVDFIAKNEDIIKELKKIGFIEIIVGMEGVENNVLNSFNKESTLDDNIKTVKILRNNNINLTSLFIANIDFKTKDFTNMRRWIRKMKLKSYTVSIFTPIKGTDSYEQYENKIITKDYAKWDFLHLIMKPGNMNTLAFYVQFYLIYIQLFISSKYIRSFCLKSWKKAWRIK